MSPHRMVGVIRILGRLQMEDDKKESQCNCFSIFQIDKERGLLCCSDECTQRGLVWERQHVNRRVVIVTEIREERREISH